MKTELRILYVNEGQNYKTKFFGVKKRSDMNGQLDWII